MSIVANPSPFSEVEYLQDFQNIVFSFLGDSFLRSDSFVKNKVRYLTETHFLQGISVDDSFLRCLEFINFSR